MSAKYGALASILIALAFSTIFSTVARADPLYLSQPIQPFNIYVTNVDTKYTIFDKAAGIGKFAATGTPQWLATTSNVITAGSYTVNVFFDLATGAIRQNDPNNSIDVLGKLATDIVPEHFFQSSGVNAIKHFGWGSVDSFDFTFTNNTGTVKPGSDIMTRIMGVSIPNFDDPTFKYTVAPSDVDGKVIFDNTPIGTVEKGVANVWAPTPSAASGLVVLLLGFGAYQAVRRFISQGWLSA